MAGKNWSAEVQEKQKSIDFTKKKYQIVFDTSMGKIVLDMWPDKAPGHCKNMLGLTMCGYYDNLIFHRVIKGFMNQGGCPDGTGTGGPGYSIDAEFNDAPHDPGVLSMARTNDPNSAGSQFFLCNAPAHFLDRQYTAFGKTADDESLAVVKEIGNVKTNANDRPIEPVTIKSATVLETDL